MLIPKGFRGVGGGYISAFHTRRSANPHYKRNNGHTGFNLVMAGRTTY
jgi:hypothetical protein